MKKLLMTLLLCVTAAGLFAAVAPQADDLGKALEQAQTQAAADHNKKVDELKKEVKDSLAYFTEFASRRHYSEFHMMFQGMDRVRESFMELYKVSQPAAKAMAQEVNKPISIDNGNNQIRIADYVRMESVVLGSISSREEARWIEFGDALEKSLK